MTLYWKEDSHVEDWGVFWGHPNLIFPRPAFFWGLKVEPCWWTLFVCWFVVEALLLCCELMICTEVLIGTDVELKSQFSTVTSNVTYKYESATNAASAIYIALLSSDLRVCDYKFLENPIFQWFKSNFSVICKVMLVSKFSFVNSSSTFLGYCAVQLLLWFSKKISFVIVMKRKSICKGKKKLILHVPYTSWMGIGCSINLTHPHILSNIF